MTKERWFNYRPICLVFAFLLLGSVFAFFVAYENTISTIISIIAAVLVMGFILIIAIKKKKLKYFFIPLLSLLIGVLVFNLTIYNFNKGIKSNYLPSVIEARISSVGKENDSYLYLQADSVVLDGDKIKENIIIYCYDTSSLYEKIEVGAIVKFNPSSFYHEDIFKHEIPYAKLITNNIKYVTSVNISKLSIIGIDKTFAETIKEKVKENLSLGLTNENTEIAYSSLFGEKTLLSEDQYSAYQLSGIAHLLAVSGLHVGIIVGLFRKAFKRMKKRPWIKLVVICPLLLMYVYICNFAYSVIRAGIMATILLLSDVLGTEYDSYCSISLAGIVIYFINPLCVFDVSFLMSFGCVIGIAMLYKPIYKMLTVKIYFNKTIASSVAMSLSATISLLFIMAFFFQNLNFISIIANIIIIPIFTVAFTCNFIVSIISLLLPVVAHLLHPINYILDFTNILATMFGNLSISNFNTLSFNYIGIIIYFVFILLIGRLCTAKYQYKLAVTLPIVALLVCCLI